MLMPGRHWGAKGRYGFNGMETDDEVSGEGNSLDFGARIYDPRLGRWMSIDPLMAKYAYLTPYHFTSNSPIAFKDLDGKDFTYSISKSDNTIIIHMTVYAVNRKAYRQAVEGAHLWNQTTYTSKGYTVKFDIQVSAPPSITESEVLSANINGIQLYKKNGEKNKEYYKLEGQLQDEKMLEIAKRKYATGATGDNNVYAGSNDFAGEKSLLIDATVPGTYEVGNSDGQRIVMHKIKRLQEIRSGDVSGTTYGTGQSEEVVQEAGDDNTAVGHELGHNLGLPDYTKEGKTSGGIMDYDFDHLGKPSQIEIDDLINEILDYDEFLKGDPSRVTSPDVKRTFGSAKFKSDKQPK